MISYDGTHHGTSHGHPPYGTTHGMFRGQFVDEPLGYATVDRGVRYGPPPHGTYSCMCEGIVSPISTPRQAPWFMDRVRVWLRPRLSRWNAPRDAPYLHESTIFLVCPTLLLSIIVRGTRPGRETQMNALVPSSECKREGGVRAVPPTVVRNNARELATACPLPRGRCLTRMAQACPRV